LSKLSTQTIAIPSLLEHIRGRRASLEVLSGASKGQRFLMNGLVLRVGSAPDNDLVLEDATVSKHHFRIELDPRGYRILDLGSKNGLQLGDLRVTEAFLPDRCKILAGKLGLRFKLTREELDEEVSVRGALGDMVGQSLPMRRLFARLSRLAESNITVLLEGESGTGKELAAETLHALSPRAGGPFVVLDCGAIPEHLMESQLFGHRKGAFTGATENLTGALERASSGTLFVDEVGELPLGLQTKLLRALDKGQYQPLGGEAWKSSDARIVAATNRDLKAEVAAGRFREDLYFRLAVVGLRLPSLRERPEDIPHLVDRFVEELGGALSWGGISQQRLEEWKRLDWPGNVRELRNAVERELVLGPEDQDDPGAPRSLPGLESFVQGPGGVYLPYKEAKARLLGAFEASYWSGLLARNGGNVSAAAREAGIHRKSLEYLLKRKEPGGDPGAQQ
jgi:DNA-binding NtrC family response regulator